MEWRQNFFHSSRQAASVSVVVGDAKDMLGSVLTVPFEPHFEVEK
jgi:hypothetical protein